MLTERRNWLIIGGCLLGILSCLLLFALGYIGMKMMTPRALKYPQEARRKVGITIDVRERQELFDQLRKFADKYDFKIIIDTRPSGDENFSVDMYGKDVEIHGANPFAPGEYKLGFYDADRQHPAPESVLDDLVNDLQSFVSEVPSAMFSVEK